MLRIRTGKTFYSLEKDLVRYLSSLWANNPATKILVVVPSNHILKYLQTVLVKKYQLNILNTYFSTFYTLALEICRINAKLPGPILNETIFSRHLLQNVLIILKNSKKWDDVLLTPGFVAAIYNTVEDLVQSGLNPENLYDWYKDQSSQLESLQPNINQIIELYTYYQKMVDKLPVTTEKKLITLATEQVAESKYLQQFTEIVYYGFYDLNGLQTDFFHSVSSNFPVTTYFLTDKNLPALSFAKEYYENYLQGKAKETIAVEGKEQEILLGKQTPCLFQENIEEKISFLEDNINIITTTGAGDEIWATAKEILRLVEEEEYQFADIGVLARSLEPYSMLVEEIFTEHKIPYVTGAGTKLLRYPLSKFCLRLLTLAREDFPGKTVLDLITSPYLNFPGYQEDKKLRTELANLITDRRIDYGYTQWEKRLCHGSSKEKVLVRFIKELDNEFKQISKTSSWQSCVDGCLQILKKYVNQSSLSSDKTLREQEVWDTLIKTLTELKQLDISGTETSLAEFLDVLSLVWKEATLPLVEEDIAGVSVMDVMSARVMSFKVVFLIGLQEKLFPRVIREDPFLRDSLREKIVNTLGNKIQPKLKGYDEEKLLFYLSLNSAEQKLYCLYQRSDEEGRKVVESTYLHELQRVIQLKKKVVDIPRPVFEKIDRTKDDWLTAKELSLKVIHHQISIDNSYNFLGIDTPWLATVTKTAEKLEHNRNAGPFDGFTDELTEYNHSAKNKGISPSSLETYGKCPYQYFCSYVLNLGEVEEPTTRSEVNRGQLGTIYHEILAEFYKQVRRGLKPRTTVERPFTPTIGIQHRILLDKTVKDVFNKYNCDELGLYPVLWQAIKDEVEENINALVEKDFQNVAETGFSPAYIEEEIKGRIEFPFLKNVPDVVFRGKFDRIDLNNGKDKFRLVDYKLKKSAGAMETEAINGGKVLALALYIPLCISWLDSKLNKPVALENAVWYLLERTQLAEEKTESTLSKNFWEIYGDQMVDTLNTFLDNIFSGRFFIYPGRHCDYCPFSTICRKNYYPVIYRAERNEFRLDYNRIKEKKKTKKND